MTTEPRRVNWQYPVERLSGTEIDNEEALDFMGRNGWELVTVLYVSGNTYLTAFLKRPFPRTEGPVDA